MIKRIAVLGAVLGSLSALLGPALSVVAQTPTALQRTVEIRAERDWQDSGVPISRGDRVRVEYRSGSWEYWPGQIPPSDASGPAGRYRYVCADVVAAQRCNEVVPDFPKGALVGRLAGRLYKIGNLLEFAAEDTGPLMLRINDGPLPGDLADNRGAVTVQITIQGAPPAAPAPALSGTWVNTAERRSVGIRAEGGRLFVKLWTPCLGTDDRECEIAEVPAQLTGADGRTFSATFVAEGSLMIRFTLLSDSRLQLQYPNGQTDIVTKATVPPNSVPAPALSLPSPDLAPSPAKDPSAQPPPSLPDEPTPLRPLLLNVTQCGSEFLGVGNLISIEVILLYLAEGKSTDALLEAVPIPYLNCIEAIPNLLVPGQLPALQTCLTENTPDAQECRRFLGQRLRELAPDIKPPEASP